MKFCKPLFLILLSVLGNGCLTNSYEQHYTDNKVNIAPSVYSSNNFVELKIATTEDDVFSVIENGYVAVGYASFYGPYTPLSLAIKTAQKHDATLALLDIQYKETKQYTSVIFLPSYSTSHSHGSINTNIYRPYGTGYGTATYSGRTTTTTIQPVPIIKNQNIYSHNAMFFKKIDISSLYGAMLWIPKRLPDEKNDSPVQIYILAVFHGSQAEKDGLKRGQIVKKINGTAVTKREDIKPYMSDLSAIKTIEVEYEK